MRRVVHLTLATVSSSAIMLLAAFVAQANSPLRVGWMIPQEVSQSNDARSKGPRMAVDDSGDIHLIWMDETPGQADLYYVRSTDQGSTWSGSEHIATPLESEDGSLAVGSSGTIHACWWELSWEQTHYEYNLLHAQKSTSSWSLQPTVVVTTGKISHPAIAQAAGHLHVVWSGKPSPKGPYVYYSRKSTSAETWADPTVIADTEPMSLYAMMTVDTSDNLHVVWQENVSPYSQILYVSGTVGMIDTTWSSPITVSTGLGTNATTPDIFVGADGMVHTAFGVDVAGQANTQDVYHARFPVSNTDNISPSLIPGSRSMISAQLPRYASPSIVVDGADNVHVAWNGVRGSDLWDRIYHVVSDDQGESWSQPMAISPDDAWPDGYPAMATDGTLIHLAWQQKALFPDNDIYYSHSLPTSTLLPLALKEYS